MTVRQFDFIVGPEQSEIPGASNPITDSGAATLTNKTIDGDDNTITDLGYIYTATFTAESSKVIDVTADGIDSRKCIVQVLDQGDTYATSDIKVTRTSSTNITLEAGASITATFTVLVFEVRA